MFCPNCGYPLLDDTVKCEYCGFVIKSKDNKKQTGSEQGSMMNKNVGVGGSAAEGMGTGDNRNRADRRRAANHGGFSAGTSNGKRGGNGGQRRVHRAGRRDLCQTVFHPPGHPGCGRLRAIRDIQFLS